MKLKPGPWCPGFKIGGMNDLVELIQNVVEIIGNVVDIFKNSPIYLKMWSIKFKIRRYIQECGR